MASVSQFSKSRLRTAITYLNLAILLTVTTEGSIVSELSSAICEVLSKQEKCTWSGCVPVEWTATGHGCGQGTVMCQNPSRCAGGWQYKCCEVPTELGVSLSASKRGVIHVPFPGLGRMMSRKAAGLQRGPAAPVWWWSALKPNGNAAGVRKGPPPSAAATSAKRGGEGNTSQGQPEAPVPSNNVDLELDRLAADYDDRSDDGDSSLKSVH